MKKVLVFIGGYLPGQNYGGPVTSIYNFSELLGDDYQIRIVCCDHDLGSTERYKNIEVGWNQVGKAKVNYLPDYLCGRKSFGAIMKEENPDIIYASGIMHFRFNAPIIVEAKKREIPILLAPRGDICKNALHIKAWKKMPFLFCLKKSGFFSRCYFHATMDEEVTNLVKYLGVNRNRICKVPNIPCTVVHRDNYTKQSNFAKIVFVSRIQLKKNLLTAIQAVSRMKQNALFDIYGPIENQKYWDLCREEIEKAPSYVTIRYRGALSTQDAKCIYSDYDCFLFPTFSENYGHVIIEAMLHDCPIIISRGTTPWDDVEESGAGYTVPLQNVDGFAQKLDSIASMDNKEYAQMMLKVRRYAAEKVQLQSLKSKYINMLELKF